MAKVTSIESFPFQVDLCWRRPRMTRSGSRRKLQRQLKMQEVSWEKSTCNCYCHLGMDCHFISKIVKRTVLVIVKKVAVSQRGWIHCVSQGLNSQWNIVCRRMRFWCFWGTSDSEWALFKWLDESGSKFWIQNTCGNVKSDFWTSFELQNAIRHFLWVTLYSF